MNERRFRTVRVIEHFFIHEFGRLRRRCAVSSAFARLNKNSLLNIEQNQIKKDQYYSISERRSKDCMMKKKLTEIYAKVCVYLKRPK